MMEVSAHKRKEDFASCLCGKHHDRSGNVKSKTKGVSSAKAPSRKESVQRLQIRFDPGRTRLRGQQTLAAVVLKR